MTFDAKKHKDKCVTWIKKFFEKNGPDCNAIVGISGGKDSTVVAALCVEALGKDRVIGVLMPQGIQSDIDVARKVCDYLDVPIQDTIAFGDSMNDYQMLEKANQGIVFEGAKEKLLDIAYDTFKDPDQDGIALSLEKLGLI